jgi:hypothetical protein
MARVVHIRELAEQIIEMRWLLESHCQAGSEHDLAEHIKSIADDCREDFNTCPQCECVIIRADGRRYEATNQCAVDGLDICPRIPAGCATGTGYELCGSTHAEANAAALAAESKDVPGEAYLKGHTWLCVKYLSVCSGIEAATVAWHPLGWSPLLRRDREIPQRRSGASLPACAEPWRHDKVQGLARCSNRCSCRRHPLPVLFGRGTSQGTWLTRAATSCSPILPSLTLSPRMAGLGERPRRPVVNEGRDFGTFIGGLEELGYHAAWRVLDAQYVRVDGFGRAVPQRRRRVFVVGYLGDWRRAAAVLLERESLSREFCAAPRSGAKSCPQSIRAERIRRWRGRQHDEGHGPRQHAPKRRRPPSCGVPI